MPDLLEERGPKNCLVTGAAGFIGSKLCQRLLDKGYKVTGLDLFTDYYERQLKEENLKNIKDHPGFRLVEADLVEILNLGLEKESFDWVFHQAAQAGVRRSWGEEFAVYTHHNVLATQRLLEWAKLSRPEKIIYASSSSVYGDALTLPMQETDLPAPLSPYGVSKLAAEHLMNLYYKNFGLPVVSLRYFTVYGPGQRPDMAFHIFFKALKAGKELVIYGTGEQTRDFTYIDDIVKANLLAALSTKAVGQVYNIGGGSRVSVNQVLEMIAKITGLMPEVRHKAAQAGDAPHTYACTKRAKDELGFKPKVSLEKGLKKMASWFGF